MTENGRSWKCSYLEIIGKESNMEIAAASLGYHSMKIYSMTVHNV
jgi:hypothetical protein